MFDEFTNYSKNVEIRDKIQKEKRFKEMLLIIGDVASEWTESVVARCLVEAVLEGKAKWLRLMAHVMVQAPMYYKNLIKYESYCKILSEHREKKLKEKIDEQDLNLRD